MRILLIIESVMIRSRVLKLLYEFIPCSSVVSEKPDNEEFMDVIEDYAPEVIITDIQFFSEGAADLYNKIRMSVPDVKVMAIDNCLNRQYRKKYDNLGIEFYYDKPSYLRKMTNDLISLQMQIENSAGALTGQEMI